jgi:ATP-dependent helicase/nuclease subunit B
MVGCDDRQLPNLTDHGLIFSKAMVASLGLATMEDQYQQYARDLSALIQAHPHTDFLWQEWQQAQERNRCAGWLTRLQFELGHLANKKITLPQRSTLLGGQTTAKASLQIGDTLFPKSISPSSYKTLRECPYRFYATRLLGLWAPSALQSSSEFGMVGNVLHAILARFYRQLKIQDASNLQAHQAEYDRPQWMHQQLQRISNQQWQPLIEYDGKLLGMRQEWLDQIPHWIDWQIEQEANGWAFASAEVPVTFQLDLGGGTQLEITGRADRFDTHASLGTARVLDYKFQVIQKIIDKERFIGDDPQLLIYARGANGTSVVHDQPITIGAWCSLKSPDNLERVHDIEINANVITHLTDQMQEDLGAIWQGAAMPASGPEQVCRYCDVRGICRKGMWIER